MPACFYKIVLFVLLNSNTGPNNNLGSTIRQERVLIKVGICWKSFFPFLKLSGEPFLKILSLVFPSKM